MRGLPGLIRLHRFKLDEERRKLAALESLAEVFRRQIAALEDELKREADLVRGSPEAAQTYGSYLVAARARRARLQASAADVMRQIAEEHAEVARAFQDAKRYELAQENRERRAAEAARHREQSEMDEVGLNLFRRGSGGRG